MNNQINKVSKLKNKKYSFFVAIMIIIIVILVFFSIYSLLLNPFNLVPEREDLSLNELLYDNNTITILLIGSDQNEEFFDNSRADTIIIAMMDLKEESIFLLSIPRDTYVPIEGHNYDKINHAYTFGGEELLRKTIVDFLRIPIDYYIQLDFNGFKDLINALGGVEIEVDKKMYYQTYDTLIDIEAGLQILSGEEALQYVRFRSDELGDITRVSRQQLLLKSIFTKFTENTGYLKLPQLLYVLKTSVKTDLSLRDILELTFFIKDLESDAVENTTLKGNFMDINGISYWQVDEKEMRELLVEQLKYKENDNGIS